MKTYEQMEIRGNMQRLTVWEKVKEKGKAWDKGKLVDRTFKYGRMIKAYSWQPRFIEREYIKE